jgi:hypothetical protein
MLRTTCSLIGAPGFSGKSTPSQDTHTYFPGPFNASTFNLLLTFLLSRGAMKSTHKATLTSPWYAGSFDSRRLSRCGWENNERINREFYFTPNDSTLQSQIGTTP